MNDEQIKAARDKISWALKFFEHDKVADECIGLLESLCEAARQPESLVGKRVITHDDVRKMSDEVLIYAAELCHSQLDPEKTAVQEYPQTSHEEALQELARRLSVLREYYESHISYFDADLDSDEFEIPEAIARMKAAEDACRKMEAARETTK